MSRASRLGDSVRRMASSLFPSKGRGIDLESTYKLYPVTSRLQVPPHIVAPNYTQLPNGQPTVRNPYVEIKTKAQIEQMRRACELASYIREFAGKQVHVGRTTDEIDKLVHAEVIRLNVYPSPLGYCGFPKSICTSVNNVVCHGIPDLRPLENGDIINIDVSVYVDEYHGDCSGMFVAGTTSEENLRLIRATRESLDKAIAICKPGVPLKEIGEVIQVVADREGFGTVRSFTGHGIGKDFHMAPQILHYRNTMPGVMEEGMVFTIEPILNATLSGGTYEMRDGWTILTTDGANSAQFEETIAITADGADILTKHKNSQFEAKNNAV